jgi:predicted lipoprotein with Yx(FWY)xxD motif
VATGTPSGSAGLGGGVSVTTRADGSLQVTFDGHPLYHFSGDQQPGDTRGDGLNGIWHAVHPGAAAVGSNGTNASSSGYGY